MTELIFKAVSAAFFARFYLYALESTPYLAWLNDLYKRMPSWLSYPLGYCPFCFAPWVFVFFETNFAPELVRILAYGFGWAYMANLIAGKHERNLEETHDKGKTD